MEAHQKDELACTYASLILWDEEKEITADAISKIVKAAGLSVQPVYPSLFAKFLASQDLASLLSGVGSAAPAGAPAAAGAAAPAAVEAPKEAKKVEEEEEDDDMGFGLFD
eukprot:NODE_7910_length_437_cov_477.724227_g7455_i0.p1 GENE.NODE_7910_length_437_cov_477.724227_g7455_i0~~NODE_7910_length_437_cov_477.724227_g7455_i0.p1  ORF type:complete len:110 (+),score=34.79 NODE_7910_length_437_cov_477.724227_g7455_i0:65-394(+)